MDAVNAALRDTSVALVVGAMLSIGLAVLLAACLAGLAASDARLGTSAAWSAMRSTGRARSA